MGFSILPGRRPTLNDVRRFGEYSSVYRWSLQMVTPPAIFGGEPLGFNALCESTDLPSKSVDKMLIAIRGHKHYQPGIVTPSSTIQFRFVETVSQHVHNWLFRWQEAIWSHNIGTGVPYDALVCNDLVIARYNNQDELDVAYVLRYCFLENYTLPSLDGTTSGPFQMSITLSFDDFYPVGANVPAPPGVNAENYSV